jgi:Flp pilus assembly protein TadB
MKRPKRKRKKQPTPQELATASSFEPLPDAKSEKKQKKRLAKKPKGEKKPKGDKKPKGEKRQRLRGVGSALAKPLRLLGAPVRALGKLGAKPRIVVLGLLAIVVVVGVVVLGGRRDDEKLVREALAGYGDASGAKDYQTLCDDLLAKSYVRRTASSGLPCEVALRTALEDVRNPTLTVLSVNVDGDRATARVRGSAAGQVPGEADYTLVREDDKWKILPPSGDATAPAVP